MKRSAPSPPRLAALERIDTRWAWHHCALLRLRQSLLHAAAELSPADATDLASCPADHEYHSHHEAVLAESVPPEQRLPEIDAALARIRAHTYGFCEATGTAIPATRLRAMPWTRYAAPVSERRLNQPSS